MADKKDHDGREDVPKSGEVLGREETDISTYLSDKLSVFPWFNKWTKRRIKSLTDVVNSVTDLDGALINHEKTRNRLVHIHTEIEADRIEQENRRDRAKREKDTVGLQDDLVQLRLRREIAEEKQRLDNIERKSNQSDKRKGQEDEIQKVLNKVLREYHTERALRQEEAKLVAMVMDRCNQNPREEDEREIEMIRSKIQRAIDSL